MFIECIVYTIINSEAPNTHQKSPSLQAGNGAQTEIVFDKPIPSVCDHNTVIERKRRCNEQKHQNSNNEIHVCNLLMFEVYGVVWS